jgi:hypothetical protein
MSGGLYAGPWLVPIPRVADIYLKAQSTTIAPTAAVTSPAVGLYRVTLAIAITTSGTGGSLTLSCQSTGDGGVQSTQSLASVAVNGAPGTIAQDSFTCEVSASNINYQVTAIGITAGALKYTVRVVVEQLSVQS